MGAGELQDKDEMKTMIADNSFQPASRTGVTPGDGSRQRPIPGFTPLYEPRASRT